MCRVYSVRVSAKNEREIRERSRITKRMREREREREREGERGREAQSTVLCTKIIKRRVPIWPLRSGK